MDFEEDVEESSEIAPTVMLRPESVYNLLLPEELLLLTISYRQLTTLKRKITMTYFDP